MAHYDVAPVEGLHPELGILVASLFDSTREWRENLGAVPNDAMSWQPFSDGYSVGGEYLHIIECEFYWLEEFALGRASDPGHPAVGYGLQLKQDDVFWPDPPKEPQAWYDNLLDESRKKVLDLVREHNDPVRVHTMRNGESFTYRWILAHLVEHDAYHGGQAVAVHEQWKAVVFASTPGNTVA